MDFKVRVRLNRVTGEVELFEVEDQKTVRLPEAEHNRVHDRISAVLGGIIEQSPQIVEVFPGSVDLEESTAAQEPEETETQRGREAQAN